MGARGERSSGLWRRPGRCPGPAGGGRPVETRSSSSREPRRRVERCRSCPSGLVYPLRWRRIGTDVWQLHLRCPDCGDVWKERRTTVEVKRFDRALTAAREVLEEHLRSIEELEREAEIERFRMALAVDAILPEDFG